MELLGPNPNIRTPNLGDTHASVGLALFGVYAYSALPFLVPERGLTFCLLGRLERLANNKPRQDTQPRSIAGNGQQPKGTRQDKKVQLW